MANRLGGLTACAGTGQQGQTTGFPERGAVEFSLLYEDEAGDEVGLEGVQLLDEVSPGRLRDTEALLHHAHPVVRFEAALILAAWCQESGASGL